MSTKSAKSGKLQSAKTSKSAKIDGEKVTPPSSRKTSAVVKDEKKSMLPPERGAEEKEPKELTWQENIARSLRIRNVYVREGLSEFLGTFVLAAFGIACVAQIVVNKDTAPFKQNVVSLQQGWAVAVALGVYVAGGGSGAHLNPAVTVAFAITGRLRWIQVPVYLAGQYLGAFFGAVFVFLAYYNGITTYNKSLEPCSTAESLLLNCTSAGIFSTYPQGEHIETWQGFIDQVFATGLLLLMVSAITDERNMQVPKALIPIAVGITILGLLTAYESNCGAALNPARDLSPRIFSAMAGWGGKVFSYRNYNWFWVPIIGPHIGAILGVWLYNICVGLHWPVEEARSRAK